MNNAVSRTKVTTAQGVPPKSLNQAHFWRASDAPDGHSWSLQPVIQEHKSATHGLKLKTRPHPEKKILKSFGTSAALATLPLWREPQTVLVSTARLQSWCAGETPPGNKLFLRFVCCIIARPDHALQSIHLWQHLKVNLCQNTREDFCMILKHV